MQQRYYNLIIVIKALSSAMKTFSIPQTLWQAHDVKSLPIYKINSSVAKSGPTKILDSIQFQVHYKWSNSSLTNNYTELIYVKAFGKNRQNFL